MTDDRHQARVLLAEALEIDIEGIGEDASIATLEAWDSLAHMRIILAVEGFLGEELAPEVVIEIGSLGDIAAVLGRRPGPNQANPG